MLCSWPFPAEDDVAGRQADGVADRLAPVVDYLQPLAVGGPRRASAVRDLLVDHPAVFQRGSSSVTTTRSASPPPRAPSAPACGVTSPAEPKTTISRPSVIGRRTRAPCRARRRVRVVDDNPERLTGVNRLHASGHPTGVGQRRRGGPEVQPERLDHAERREGVRHIEAAGSATRLDPVQRGAERRTSCRRRRRQGPGADIGFGVQAVRDDPVSRSLAEVTDGRIVRVEHGDRRLLTRMALRAVRLNAPVELEVLARHRRDHADVEPAVPRPAPAPARATSPP